MTKSKRNFNNFIAKKDRDFVKQREKLLKDCEVTDEGVTICPPMYCRGYGINAVKLYDF